MRVSKNCADAILFNACWTTFAWGCDQFLFWWTDGCCDAFFNTTANHTMVTRTLGAFLQLPRVSIIVLLVVVVAHGFLFFWPSALGTAATRAGYLVLWRTLQRRTDRSLADCSPILALAVGALIVRPRSSVVEYLLADETSTVQVVQPLATATLGTARPWSLRDPVVGAGQHRARFLGARDPAILAGAHHARVPFVRWNSVSFHVLFPVHEASIAVGTALPLRGWPRVLAIDVAIDAGLGDDARLAEKSPTGVVGIGPFLRAAVHSAVVDTAFANVAALVSLGLLQEVAAPWQRTRLSSALHNAVLALTGDTGVVRDSGNVRQLTFIDTLDRVPSEIRVGKSGDERGGQQQQSTHVSGEWTHGRRRGQEHVGGRPVSQGVAQSMGVHRHDGQREETS